MISKYIKQIKIVGKVLLLITYTIFVHTAGANGIIAGLFKDQQIAKAEDVEKVKEVIKFKERIKVVYREKQREVKLAPTTACTDVSFADMGLLKRTTED